MFIPFIATIVVLLAITMYMSTSGIVADTAKVKMNFDKVSYVYPKEKVIVTAVEDLCRSNAAFCKAKKNNGEISITNTDLVGYIPDAFDWNNNGVEGAFTDIVVTANDSTIRITQTVPSDDARYVYLNHYQSREFGISPVCKDGASTSTPPCSTAFVIHDYPTSMEFREAIK